MSTNSSLLLPKSDSCAFCVYLRNERPYSFVFRDPDIAILVTREQRGNPHLLVIPTTHRITILDLSDPEASQLAIATRDAAKAIESEYKPSGISIWQNNGTPSSQTIGHLHFHVAGTIQGGGTIWGHVPELSLDETERIALRLRPYFQ